MATDLQNPVEPSTTSLVTGIIDDMQDLVKQQVALTKKELTGEFHKAFEAVVLYALGGAILFIGVLILCLSVVHLTHWAGSPLSLDPARIPLWGCYAIVGAPLTIIGGALTWMGRAKLQSIHPLDNPATEALKENVQWATNTK